MPPPISVFLRFLWGIFVFATPAFPLHIPDNPQAHWLENPIYFACASTFGSTNCPLIPKNNTKASCACQGGGTKDFVSFMQFFFRKMSGPSGYQQPQPHANFIYPPQTRMGHTTGMNKAQNSKNYELWAQLGTHFDFRCDKSNLQGTNKTSSNLAYPSQIAHSTWVELGFAISKAKPEFCKVLLGKIAFSGHLRTSQISPWIAPPAVITPSRLGSNPGLIDCPLNLSLASQDSVWKSSSYHKWDMTIKKQNVIPPRAPIQGVPFVLAKIQKMEKWGHEDHETTRGHAKKERNPPSHGQLPNKNKKENPEGHQGHGVAQSTPSRVTQGYIPHPRLYPSWIPQEPL